MIPAVLGTTAASSVSSTGSSNDPFFSQVLFLLEGEGSNNSTLILDSSSYNRTITRVGNPVITTNYAKYGLGSIHQPAGTNYCQIPINTNLGSTWTLEAWVWWDSWSDSCGAFSLVPNSGYVFIFGAYEDRLSFWRHLGTMYVKTTGNANNNVPPNQWSHIALVCYNNVVDIFINGVKQGKSTNNSFSDAANTVISSVKTQDLDAKSYQPRYTDFVRLTKGVARYTNSFDPQTDIVF